MLMHTHRPLTDASGKKTGDVYIGLSDNYWPLIKSAVGEIYETDLWGNRRC